MSLSPRTRYSRESPQCAQDAPRCPQHAGHDGGARRIEHGPLGGVTQRIWWCPAMIASVGKRSNVGSVGLAALEHGRQGLQRQLRGHLALGWPPAPSASANSPHCAV